MPIKKSPITRYLLLDECFRNKHAEYYFYDLFHHVNERLHDMDLEEVSERTLHDDIKFMRSKMGWEIKLAKDFAGRERIYHYEDMDYSILQMPLTASQSEMLGKTIQMLGHLQGMPNYEWLDQTLVLLREQFQVDNAGAGCVHFSQCDKLKGLDFFTPLYDVLRRQQVVEVTYHRFGQPSRKRIVHPYQLKQYNNRWYLIGLEERLRPRHKYAVLALDRMEKVKVREDIDFIPATTREVERYYEDIVGVSRLPEGRINEVLVKAYYPAAHYLETKPLHSSQKELSVERLEFRDSLGVESLKSSKVVGRADGTPQEFKVFQWYVLENEELVQQLLVYADQIEVLQGDWVKAKLRERAQKILEMNA